MHTVVIGGGAAGLWCALHAAERGPVTLVAPGAAELAATSWAQGGIAAASQPGDSPERHAADTVAAGAGLCDPNAVEVLVQEAPAAVRELRAMGMAFDEGAAPALEGGHSARRVFHAGGDASGMALHRFLAAQVSEHADIGRVDGRAVAVRVDGHLANGVDLADGTSMPAERLVLATGGACGIFGRRTGPDTSIGEGMALAWDAGAALADLEFVQFHPTALDVPGRPARLLTEALRGEGALLLDASGQRFMDRFHPSGELAPRDVVARAVVLVREETGAPVYLDARGVANVVQRFPTAAESCRQVGLDVATQPVPVAPAAHYFVGGILTDLWGRTTVPGLFAAGEVASTGVHGGNRLASNSLAEALVFGARAAVADPYARWPIGPAERLPHGSDAELHPPDALALVAIREAADRYLGVRRTGPDLAAFLQRLSTTSADGTQEASATPAATLVAWLLATSALRREESRGGHHRMDFPEPRELWRMRQAVDRSGWWNLPMPELQSAEPR